MTPEAPLHGRTILLTRPRRRSETLANSLRSLGARVIELPVTTTVPPSDPAPLTHALRERYDYAVFASVNAVEGVRSTLAAAGRGPDALGSARLVAVGPATAESLRRLGFGEALVPGAGTSDGVLEALAGSEVAGKRILVPGAREGRREIAVGLRARGAQVVEVEAYRTVSADPASPEAAEALRELESAQIGLVVLYSPSAMRFLPNLVGPRLLNMVLQAGAVAIGPTTADAARAAGFGRVLESERRTDEGVLSCIRKYFEDNR